MSTLDFPVRFRRIVKFANVHHLTMHFPKSFGADVTKVVYIGLKGEFTEVSDFVPAFLPIAATSFHSTVHQFTIDARLFQAYRQEIAICNYELAPNPADHKVEQQCSNKNYDGIQNNNNLGY